MPLTAPKQGALHGAYDEMIRLMEQAMHMPTCEDAIKRELTVDGKRAALFYVDGMIGSALIKALRKKIER